jgi:hypothetical protein
MSPISSKRPSPSPEEQRKPCANWVMVDLAARLNKEGKDIGHRR